MKKTLLTFAALITLGISITSCTEKEPTPGQPADTTENHDTTPDVEINYAEQILGQWNSVLNRCYEQYTENDDYDETTYVSDWASALSLNFKTDGKLTYSAIVGGIEDSWDDTYRIVADTLVWDTRPYKILTLTDNQLVIEFTHEEQRTASGGTILTTTLTKHWELTR